ncbi:MAG: redox-regulated ATPase YchF [Actinobacteria bacterium]|nr:redox-regulated ATPase YchF [Actinomycetota bacterium]
MVKSCPVGKGHSLSSLKVGIVGLPNVGKTTLFNALSRVGAQVASYPFTTVEPNVGVVPIPDERLNKVADLAECRKRVPASITFVDIAGLVEGASKGEGLGNRFLANIREVDAILHVIRAFDISDVSHIAGDIDPVRDAEMIETELRLADLDVLSRMIGKARQSAKSGARECVEKVKALESLESIIGGDTAIDYEKARKFAAFLDPGVGMVSLMPSIIVVNSGESGAGESEAGARIREWALLKGMPVVEVSAKIESELAELDHEEALEFEREMGIEEESLDRIVRESYQLLGLITFFSIDSGECRAWSISRGRNAQEAAGRIHTDFEKGFIKAEIVHYSDFAACGCFSRARDMGLLRVEGRDYTVLDGDVIHFKFST